jgi:hypothetical protein
MAHFFLNPAQYVIISARSNGEDGECEEIGEKLGKFGEELGNNETKGQRSLI